MKQESRPITATTGSRPKVGWAEVIVGLTGFFLVGHASAWIVGLFDAGPVATGVAMAQIAGLAGLAGFALAVAIRVRGLRSFGFTPTTGRWILIAVVGGLALFVVRGFVTTPLLELFDLDTASDLPGGAQGGLLALILTGIGIAIIGPVGEEVLFRGVIQTALLRYGAVVSTLLSAAIFSFAHGINIVMPLAFLFGILAAELYRRSGSIWPPIIAHVVHNAPTVFLYTLL